MSELSILKVSFGRVEFSDEALNRLRANDLWLDRRRRFDEQLRPLGQVTSQSLWMLCRWVAQQMSFDCVHDRFLEVRPRLISIDPRQIEFPQNGGDVVVLEFDRTVAPIDQAHEGPSMLALVVGRSKYFGIPHRKIVGND